MVPEGWKLRTINDVGSVITGSTPKTSDQTLYDGPVPFVSPADLGTGKPVTSTIKTLTEKGFAATRRIRKGSTLFTCIGSTIGKIGLAGVDLATNQQINSVVPNSSHDDAFIYYALALRARHIAMLAGKQAVPIINKSMFSDQPILTPPLPEQKKIAQILSTWDQAITATERLLENSQQRKKGLMQQLLTGKKRLPGFEGQWEWLKANEIFRTVSKKNNGDQEELLAVTQDQGVLPRSLLERRVVMPDGTTSGYKLVVPGNFIISLRSFQGGLEYSHYRGLVSPAYTVLEPIREISDGFFQQYYKSYDFIGHLAVAVIGIRDGKQISYSDFSFLKIPYPPLNEQNAISGVLTAADGEIRALKERLDLLQREKRSLMQQLLTGKRRVKVEANAA
jgi:Restriction endonuclease S subunits